MPARDPACEGGPSVDLAHASRAVLGPGGPLALALGERFEARPQQLRLAEAVARALHDRSVLLAEAGTGVGKSFAYLVPAMLAALHRRERVVVATHTIALQEQLAERDVPLLQATLPAERTADAAWSGSIAAELVKGRGNYVSIRRLALASARQERVFPDRRLRTELHRAEDWARTTADGTLSSWSSPPADEVWDHIASDRDNCQGKRCPHFDACFFQEARRRAESADLLICNHALFLADLALRSQGAGLLPRFDHVILDEAHMIEDVAADHLGIALSEGRVAHLLRTLYDERAAAGGQGRSTGVIEAIGADEHARPMVDRAIERTLHARTACERYFDRWRRMLSSGTLGNGRVRRSGMVEDELSPALRELAAAIATLRERCVDESDRTDLGSHGRRASELATAVSAFDALGMAGWAYWAELVPGRGSVPRVRLCAAPVRVGPLLAERVFDQGWGVVLTSATLRTSLGRTASARDDEGDGASEPDDAHADARGPSDPAFAHAKDRLGASDARTLALGSPFDYPRQLRVLVDASMPDPRDASFAHRVADRIAQQAVELHGRTLVLFTSFEMLDAVASLLEPALAEHGIATLAQRDGTSRRMLLDAFHDNPRSVLLGAASFWQGVDIGGQTLSCVVVTRLPFDPPNRPMTEARVELIEADGGNGFFDDSLPRALLRFRQGLGRLIRNSRDRGRLVVLDPRFVRSKYGKWFQGVVPRGVRIEEYDP